jgi:hypothetical protein
MSFRDEFAAMIEGEFSENVTIVTENHSVTIKALYSESYQEVDPETQAVVMSRKPVVSYFEDKVNFDVKVGTSRVTARNKSYRVRDIQPDGEGSVTLYLDNG